MHHDWAQTHTLITNGNANNDDDYDDDDDDDDDSDEDDDDDDDDDGDDDDDRVAHLMLPVHIYMHSAPIAQQPAG